jgi:hypothetical protein
VARSTPRGWVVASHWRPTDFALDEALKACAYLNERYPNDTYAVRAIISMAPPQHVAEEPTEPTEEPTPELGGES